MENKGYLEGTSKGSGTETIQEMESDRGGRGGRRLPTRQALQQGATGLTWGLPCELDVCSSVCFNVVLPSSLHLRSGP